MPSKIQVLEQGRSLRCSTVAGLRYKLTILKNQESITRYYETNSPAARKRLHGPQYEDVDSTLYDLYCLARHRLVPVTGPMLQEEALIIAHSLGINGFKASNGWLQRFKD